MEDSPDLEEFGQYYWLADERIALRQLGRTDGVCSISWPKPVGVVADINTPENVPHER